METKNVCGHLGQMSGKFFVQTGLKHIFICSLTHGFKFIPVYCTFHHPYKPRLLNLELASGHRAHRCMNSDPDTSIRSNAESVWSGVSPSCLISR